MSPKQYQCMYLDNIDLSGVLDQLITKERFEVRRAEKSINLYKRFLKMVQNNPSEIMVPNEDVDTTWHLHILDTEKYMIDCQAMFGQYLHHNPHFYGTDAFFAASEKTQQIYAKNFGGEVFVTPRDAGPAAAACSDMLHNGVDLNLQSAVCNGEFKSNVCLKSAACSGMLKGDTELNLKSAACSGMLKGDTELNLKSAACSGMLKGDTDLNLKSAACSGMLKGDTELFGLSKALPQLSADALFHQYNDELQH